MKASAIRRIAGSPQRAIQPVAVLDIGGSKITCLIARQSAANPEHFRLIGSGRQISRGFRAGSLTDSQALERAVRLAVEEAEQKARIQISDIVLGISGRQIESRLVKVALPIQTGIITARDMRRLEADAINEVLQAGMQLISVWPVFWRAGSQERVRDPEGLKAKELGLIMAVVTAPENHVQNLLDCVGRAHLNVSAIVPSAVASATGTLVEDECQNGATCIDMGAGATSISVFLNGAPAWLGMVPVGGAHVTSDIAQGLGTTFAAAENLKIAHGLTDAAQLDGPEPLEIGRLGDDGRLRPAILDRSALAGIIRPRIEETFELVAECLHSSAVRYSLPHRVVLTGGASALPGVKEIAQAVLGAPVRLSKPLLAEFMGQSLATPEFATASGLLLAKARGLAQPAHVLSVSPNAPGGSGEGLSQSFFSWLKDNF